MYPYRYKLFTFFIVAAILISSVIAAWSETLRVNVSVSMGDVDWKFQDVEWLDSSGEDWNIIPPSDEPVQVDKDVGRTSVSISEDGHTLDITLSNVYPWYYTEVNASIVNTGTIPIKIWKLTIDGKEYTPTSGEAYLDVNGDGKLDLLVMREGPEYCEQIHPGQSADLVIKILVLQNAPQGLTTSISVSLTAIQWNELICPTPTPITTTTPLTTTTPPTYKPTINNGNFTIGSKCKLDGWVTGFDTTKWKSKTKWEADKDDKGNDPALDGCAAKFDGELEGKDTVDAFAWLYQSFTVSETTSFRVVIRYKVDQVADSGASVTLRFGVWDGINWVCKGEQTVVYGKGPSGGIPYNEHSVYCSLTPGSYQLRFEIENDKSNNFVVLVDYFSIDP